MYGTLKIAVVVPAKNEERLIGRTIWPVPEAVDTIYVVDDGSQDRTAEVVLHYAKEDPRIRLIHHRTNKGVGAAIISGYRQAYNDGHDVFVVVGGDAQMDWGDLNNMLKPIAENKADYTKGNRFIYGHSKDSPGNAWREMPTHRILGNVTLSILTKLASGYLHINDSQMGYTALHKRAFQRIEWNKARKGYGYPAEWLMRFHSEGIRVVDVPVRAIYLENERQTQIRVRKFVFYMTGTMFKGWMARIYREYMAGKPEFPQISVHTIRGALDGLYYRMSSLRTGLSQIFQKISQVGARVRRTDLAGVSPRGLKLNSVHAAKIVDKVTKLFFHTPISLDLINYPRSLQDDVLRIIFEDASAKLDVRRRTSVVMRNAKRLLYGEEQTGDPKAELPSEILSFRQPMHDEQKSEMSD
ncbi:MAG: glycosyltransferase family 2 protein [Candidatus Thorarchaeota archaeon]|jgi:glycosyltransferase involved in cell wall biosynthesis